MRDTKLTLEPFHLPPGRRRYRIYANLRGRVYGERFDDHQTALCRFRKLESWKNNFQTYPPLQPTPLSWLQLADAEVALNELVRLFPGRTLSWALAALHDLDPEKPSITIEEAGRLFLDAKLPVVNVKGGRGYRKRNAESASGRSGCPASRDNPGAHKALLHRPKRGRV